MEDEKDIVKTFRKMLKPCFTRADREFFYYCRLAQEKNERNKFGQLSCLGCPLYENGNLKSPCSQMTSSQRLRDKEIMKKLKDYIEV